ncbi:ABC transporter permease [Nocardia goodfellowii]|uniref:Simple sugar transport system permease protein n=1 Tax=Nocardia goodfellowii TaxID=882446 RepID=A0ABS4QK43_9NOCA|nr:simple sugar transport system permease protein [Nocardia goodfellowii]
MNPLTARPAAPTPGPAASTPRLHMLLRSSATRRDIAVYGGAVLVALLVGLALVVVGGADPATAANALWAGMFGSPYGFGSALNAAAVLALIGTGFTIAYRAGLVNVGAEGQLALGGIAATAVGVTVPQGIPALVGVPLVLVAGFAAGAAWAGIAAWLAVWRGTSEVITTLLLNFVGLGAVTLVVHEQGLLRQPVTSADTLPQSEPLAEGARLPLLGMTDSPATIAVALAGVAAVVVSIVLRRTATGTRLSAVGLSAPAAARLGLPVSWLRFGALSVAGGLAGVAGAGLVATVPFVLAEHFTSGYGFAGLVVGLLARGSLSAVAGISLVFGLLASGGINVQLAAGVPASSVQVVQSVLIILVAGAVILRKGGAR